MIHAVVDPLTWKKITVARGCEVHSDPADCEGELQAHHVITQQSLRRRDMANLLWDTRNGFCACEKSHRRHTLAVERIPRWKLPQHAIEFATEIGLDWQIERYYPEAA